MLGIPYFGFIVVAIYLYQVFHCLFKGKSLYSLYVFSMAFSCCLEINSLGGYMFKTAGGNEIAYNEVVIGLTSAIALIMLVSNKMRIKKKLLIRLLIFNLIIFLGIAFAVILPSDAKILDATTGNWDAFLAGESEKTSIVIGNQTYLMLVRCAIISLLLLVSKAFLKRKDYQKIVSSILVTIKIHLIFVLFEYVTQTFFSLSIASQFRTAFFGLAKATYTGIIFRGSHAELQGFTKEPSHLSDVLFLFVAFIILTKSVNKNIIWLVLTVFLWLISGAFSAIMYIAALGLMYYICYREERITIKENEGRKIKIRSSIIIICILIIGGIGFTVLIFNNEYLVSRMEKAIAVITTIYNTASIGKLGSSSETARIYGAFDTIRTVLTNRPLFGFGLGTAYAHSGIACALGQIGILGVLSWMQLLKQYINFDGIRNKKNIEWIYITVFILPNILKGDLTMIYSTRIIPMLFLISTYAKYKINTSVVCLENKDTSPQVPANA